MEMSRDVAFLPEVNSPTQLFHKQFVLKILKKSISFLIIKTWSVTVPNKYLWSKLKWFINV